MVGVLAMAAAAAPPPVKDYEIEPCKKRRKDDNDRSSCKTITKYLSPVGKTGDKVFSPSKSSNIMHYFRKTSPTNEKLQSANDCKINSSSPLPTDNNNDYKTSLEMFSNAELKKKRKMINLSHQLSNIKTETESPVEISSDDSRDEYSLNNDFVEKNASVSLHKKQIEIVAESIQDSRNQSNTITTNKSFKKVNPKQGTSKNDCKRLRKRKHRDVIVLSESLPLAEELKECKDGKQIMPSLTHEIESVTNYANARDHEMVHLNDSTITVSYEEFLKSHKESQGQQIPDSTMSICVSSDTVEMAKNNYISELANCEITQQVHFKTVTVLAQVHPTPPKKTGKIPAIFLKQKQSEMETSFSDPENEQTVQKRKSNVVIQEEELELAVLEAGGLEAVKPKCSLEERQQFMKAFRQPVSDTLKNGIKKSSDKLKDLNEKSNEEERENSKTNMENSSSQMASNNDSSQSHIKKGNFSKGKSKKLKEKGKKTLDTSVTENREHNTQVREPTFSLKSKQSQNKYKMSLRQKKSEVFKSSTFFNSESLVCDDPLKIPLSKQTPRKTSTPIKDKVMHSKAESEDGLTNLSTHKPTRRSLRSRNVHTSVTLRADSEDIQDKSPVKKSSPSEKHSLYTAELLTVASDSESPIRMKFIRISTPRKSKKKSRKFETTDEDFISQTRKASSTSNLSKAKQLIEKAKALHISRSKTNEEIVTPLRRSSRHLQKEKSPESDDSLILIDSSPTCLKKPEKNVKKLQCLNDVLGKKPSKNIPGKMKIAPLFLARKPQKPANPVLDFVENSQDPSEKSQNCDTQFKAKREFLMSGLPDSLKRQIAKKAAALDVYNAASASFQKVVHVQQKDDGYWLWHLKTPSCPLLTQFRELSTKVIDLSKCVIALGEFSTLNSNLNSNSAVSVTRTRKDFTKDVRDLLLEEIRWSNPTFALGKYFPMLLQKQLEHQVLSEGPGNQESPQFKPDVSQKETKRKRVETGNQKSKRKKPNEYSVGPEKINVKSEELDKRNIVSEIKPNSSKDSGTEDMLWTEKYQPQNANELIGNDLAIKKLHSWLKDWKRRAELEERQNLKGNREEKLEDRLDFDSSSDDEESHLCNTVLITGPTGVGKTAAVYACAQELGFKIFEVNASSQRSGRQILSQLKEATQSHQVDKQGVNSQKPCFFNSYHTGKSPKKLNSPKRVVSSPRKHPPSSPKNSGQKRSLPPRTLANYFKISSKPKCTEEAGTSVESKKGMKNSSLEQKQINQTKSTNEANSDIKEFGAEELNRKNATSLILFEEVDIIFDEDAGFLNAIKTFMATTKRPVILTTSDPTFSLVFDGCFEEINFSTPSLLNAASYLQMICLTENFRTDAKDFITLLTANACDIRKSILYLQFWIRSGGGFLKERPLPGCQGGNRNALICSEEEPDSKNKNKSTKKSHIELPKCDTGCAETSFGLKNIFSPSEDLFSFLKRTITTKEEWHKLIQVLSEFHMQNVDFLYSNLEFILPLPVGIIPDRKAVCGSSVTVDTSAATSVVRCPARKQSERQQPLKKSQKKKQKKMVILDDSDLFDTGLDFSDEFTSLSPESSLNLERSNPETKKRNKCSELDTETIPYSPETPTEKNCSALVSHCLNSLTEFMDNLSFLDAFLTDGNKLKESGKNDYRWTSGKVKSGLCDEFSLENSDGWASQSSIALKATAEALSITKCSSSTAKALESLSSCEKQDPTNDLTFHVSEKRNSVCFNQSAANSDNALKRIAIIKSVFSSRSLLNLGNKQASIIEYLPTLRNICRTEKLKEQGKNKRRFLHYFEGIHLDIPKEIVNTLAADFP